ncbi:hypothetical protein PIB30_011451 [Stylosanthes scabra]|uniref:Uncharacterized protein n=1 Tax=Stylosanthes scabra TaxID=79078 RepID=A0ABU6R4N2_9FABA|nr:hypothetical protein [Stylosanthes scabra]
MLLSLLQLPLPTLTPPPIQTATTHTLDELGRRRRQGRTTKPFSGEAVCRFLRLLPGKSPPPPRRGRRTPAAVSAVHPVAAGNPLPSVSLLLSLSFSISLTGTALLQPYSPPCNWSRHRRRRETSPKASAGPAASHIGETVVSIDYWKCHVCSGLILFSVGGLSGYAGSSSSASSSYTSPADPEIDEVKTLRDTLAQMAQRDERTEEHLRRMEEMQRQMAAFYNPLRLGPSATIGGSGTSTVSPLPPRPPSPPQQPDHDDDGDDDDYEDA